MVPQVGSLQGRRIIMKNYNKPDSNGILRGNQQARQEFVVQAAIETMAVLARVKSPGPGSADEAWKADTLVCVFKY
jgi:hypothetical protein